MRIRLSAIAAALAATVLAAGVLAGPAAATTYDRVFGGAYAAASYLGGSTTENYSGSGSWYKGSVSPAVEIYIAPSQLGGSFTVGDIQAIRYRTYNDGTNPSGVDFFLKIYTEPYVGGDASWYGNRLNAEPLYSNTYTPLANAWTEWTTDAGANQFVFFDGNHTTNFGFYNGPTLQDVTAGDITWSSYAGAGGGSDPSPIDYASQNILYIGLGTGSGWSSFAGYLDAIEIELVGGDTYVIDLEDYVDEVWVDDDWAGAPPGVEVEPGHFFGHNAFATVQDGVDNVSGSTVHVAAGTYEEQVVIDGMDVSLEGDGIGSTIIQSPPSLTAFYTTGSNNNYPVILAENSGNITIQDLTVDGLGRGNANYRFQGIGYYEAGGVVLNVEVLNIEDTPFSGAQHGVGVYAYNTSGGPFSLELGNVDVYTFQKNAFALSGVGLTLDVHDCDMAGVGPTTVTAQNGLQIGYGAGGTVTDCTVADIDYTPATYVGTAVLLYQGTAVDFTDGITITDCQQPMYWIDNIGSMNGVEVVNGGQFDAVTVYNSTVSKAGLQTSGSAVRGTADPFDAELAGSFAASAGVLGAATAQSLTVTNSCLTGIAEAGSWGIDCYSSGAPTTVIVSNTSITNFDAGLATVGAAAVLTAHDNSVAGNAVSGYDNTNSGAAQDATGNWWGAADGPSGDGPGTGDAVLSVGGEVDFDPYRISGSSSGPCAFLPDNNLITPVPDDPCISTINSCVNVAFDIDRTDNLPMRGFSVTFLLSPELELCTPALGDIVEGTYLSSLPSSLTQMFVLDNGGGSYTVDVSILGVPCGQTAASGTLFTVDVGAAGGDGTGTVTVTSVAMRDCVNAPIAADAGGSAAITLDTAAPAAMTDLAAAQMKTGNDSDGTTKIQINFTPPVDAVAVEVYRKGFGDYPEYDDGSGAVPAAPATPAAALGNGWTLTAVVSDGDFDESASRDFWYYVAFSEDACGNVSAVSNRTGGTLGYHLGDVTDGVTPGTGDNLVAFIDITALGAAYGTSDGDLDYRNFIDVGPTTDFSVDALPTTDNQIQFEDLMMFAINYNLVSKPVVNTVAGTDALKLRVPRIPAAGSEFDVAMDLTSTGRLQGLSVPLTWNADVVTPVDYASGELLGRQAGEGVALSPAPGTVDAAVLGSTIVGDGVLATVRFRVTGAGDPAIGVGKVSARDAHNRPVPIDGVVLADDVRPTALVTALLPGAPNPFRAGTNLAFTLAADSPVRMKIYALDGRLVRTLTDGVLSAGEHRVAWDGRDDRGLEVAAGSYLIRFETTEYAASRRVVRLP